MRTPRPLRLFIIPLLTLAACKREDGARAPRPEELVVTATAADTTGAAPMVAQAREMEPPLPAYNSPADGYNREQYSAIVENEFRDVRNNPLSTFAIDVDAASYANVRRFLG